MRKVERKGGKYSVVADRDNKYSAIIMKPTWVESTYQLVFLSPASLNYRRLVSVIVVDWQQ